MNIKFLIAYLIFIPVALAESSLPDCKGKDTSKWHDCVGAVAIDGTSYVGEFRNGQKNGKGTFTYADGATYFGIFKNGKEHGQGTFTCWNHGSQYIGEFRNGKKHGMGKYSYPDGATYVGQYQNGLLHGQGKLTLPDGSVKKGLFKNDKFVSK